MGITIKGNKKADRLRMPPKSKRTTVFEDSVEKEEVVPEDPGSEGEAEKKRRKRKRKKTAAEEGANATEGGSGAAEADTSLQSVPESAAAFVNDRTVYIEGIPFTCTEDDVRSFFQSVKSGSITSLRLPTWHDSGRLRGYGHVEFQNSDAANQALKLDGAFLGKRFIKVTRPLVPRILQKQHVQQVDPSTVVRPPGCRTIFVKNLPYDTTEEEITQSFKVFGKIKNVRIAKWEHTNQQKGVAYIDFEREESAEIAIKKGLTIRSRPLGLDFETGAPKMSFKGSGVKK